MHVCGSTHFPRLPCIYPLSFSKSVSENTPLPFFTVLQFLGGSNPHVQHCTKHLVRTNLPSIGVTYNYNYCDVYLDGNSQKSLDSAHMKVNFMLLQKMSVQLFLGRFVWTRMSIHGAPPHPPKYEFMCAPDQVHHKNPNVWKINEIATKFF